jgi:hypothetical protein
MVIQTTKRLSQPVSNLRFCLQPPGRLRASGSHRRIHFVYLAELTCNLSIAVCIKESAENRVRLRMHVDASVAFLQRLKFVDRVFIGHHALALRPWEVPAVHLSYGDLTPRPHFCADCFQDGASCKPSRPACKGDRLGDNIDSSFRPHLQLRHRRDVARAALGLYGHKHAAWRLM